MPVSIYLKAQKEKSVLMRHPWIFSGAIERIEGEAENGTTVDVLTAAGKFLGRAAYSPVSSIRARIWSWNEQEAIDVAFFKRRIQSALALRRATIPVPETDALRLIHAESDGLPGVIVDRYGDVLVLQCLFAGAEYWRDTLVNLLVELTGLTQIYERSDVDVRRFEGLPERTGQLHGLPVPQLVQIEENGLKFKVDIQQGQKTGFFLDQRRNRQLLRQSVDRCDVLNCFCYTGAFSVYALAGGASSVLSVDSSDEALKLAQQNAEMNNLDTQKLQWFEGDVFQYLRTLRDSRKNFDVIILDPPKFAHTAVQAERAARGYKDINLLAFKLLRPGGCLFTFSCSGGVSPELFKKIVTGAALDAGVDASIVGYLNQGPDHPVSLYFPEGTYLKGLICRVRE